jgi:hypothetical protein
MTEPNYTIAQLKEFKRLAEILGFDDDVAYWTRRLKEKESNAG